MNGGLVKFTRQGQRRSYLIAGEACTAYIKSQVGSGWVLSHKPYEDGGYSGGSLDRPAFRRLLADINSKRIDVVVVYKVDRLTRSLADFAKIMEVLDAAGASFVSVTQSFNTTSSMGRLTLNVLLSFAQFEREVTGERIRDKFAASKAKGMWMGGKPPLGYDGSGRTLVINEAEADRVRLIFQRFIALGSVIALAEDLKERGVVSKKWTSAKGIAHGGLTITRGGLYAVLTNPIYRGMIRHKGKLHQGLHPAIIDKEVWEAAQEVLAKSDPRASPTTPTDFLLGKVFDDAGHAMAATWSSKGNRQRYRYYVSQPALRGRSSEAGSLRRIACPALEDLVIAEVTALLDASWSPHSPAPERAMSALTRVEVGARRLVLEMHDAAVDSMALAAMADAERVEDRVRIAVGVALAKPRNSTTLLRSDGSARPRRDRALIRAVVLAHAWMQRLDAGNPRSIIGLAKAEKACVLHTAKLLPLAYLAPNLVEMILEGRQPPRLTLTALIAQPLPHSWPEQRAHFAALR